MSDKCLKCNAEVKFGKLIEKDGKKQFEKFDLDGKPHVCPTRQSAKQFTPQKPREEFSFKEAQRFEIDGKTIMREYEMKRFGFIGELNPDKMFTEMKMEIWKHLANEAGNATTGKGEPSK